MQLKIVKGESQGHPFRGNQWTQRGGALTFEPGSCPTFIGDETTESAIKERYAQEYRAKDIIRRGGAKYLEQLPEYAGSNTEEIPGALLSDYKLRRVIKNDISADIAERAGVPYEEVNTVLGAWSESCRGYVSLEFQEAIAEELGVPISDYQKEVNKPFTEMREKWEERQKWKDEAVSFKDAWLASHNGSYRIVAINIAWGELHPDAPTIENIISSPDHKPFGEYKLNRSDLRKIARAMYDYTQETLKDAPDMILLHRGMKSPKVFGYSISDNELQNGIEVGYHGNSVESWSAQWDSASDFTGSNGGIILSMMVPKKAIFSTSITGLGCLPEYEFGVLGSVPGHMVWAESYYNAYSEP